MLIIWRYNSFCTSAVCFRLSVHSLVRRQRHVDPTPPLLRVCCAAGFRRVAPQMICVRCERKLHDTRASVAHTHTTQIIIIIFIMCIRGSVQFGIAMPDHLHQWKCQRCYDYTHDKREQKIYFKNYLFRYFNETCAAHGSDELEVY